MPRTSSMRREPTWSWNVPRGGRGLLTWFGIAAVGVATLAGTYMAFVEPPPPKRIVIATGGRTGAYHRHAEAYAAELREDGLTVEVRETAGSQENLRLLADDDAGVAVAIVQGGVVGPEDEGRLLALGSLYREPFWVFHRLGPDVDRLKALAGKRVGIGAPGSGTQAVARRLLNANGLLVADGIHPVEADADTATEALLAGELDAACFVASFEAEYIRRLLDDDRVQPLGFRQAEAYRRRFRFLATVTLPQGAVDLGNDVPDRDIPLLAPTAMLVARQDFHPALIPLLLAAATRVHGAGDVMNEPREFPSEAYCDLPLSEEAARFYRSGQPVLQRLLPFWVASMLDRAKVMLIPLVMLLMPLVRAAPPLMRWQTRRRIYRWYSDLRAVDQRLAGEPTGAELDEMSALLDRIERQVARLNVPLSYMEEFYHLRLHLGMLRQHLAAYRARHDATAPTGGE